MNKRYGLAKRIHQITGWQVSTIFLAMNIMFWAAITLAMGSAWCCLFAHSLEGYRIELICAAAGAATVLGFFGGALYLYRQ